MKEGFYFFRKSKRSYYSLILLLFIFFVSLISEFVANDKPLLVFYKGNILSPVITFYDDKTFGGDSILEANYKQLLKTNENIFAIKPLIFWSYNESNAEIDHYPSPPTMQNILGTDDRGRDILTRLIYGFRISIFFSIVHYIVSVFIAIIIGTTQGFLGGRVDFLGQRSIEIFDAIPYFFVLILLQSIYEPGFFMLAVLLGLFTWIGLSYYMRAESLKVVKEDYIQVSKAIGSGKSYILLRHVIPNTLTPLITFTPFILSSGILSISSLDFLGFGVQPPTPSIGELIKQGKDYLLEAWWLAIFPVLSLAIVTLLFVFINEGVRNAFYSREENS